MENLPVYGAGTNANYSIRGVAQNDYNDGTESPVASYIDEVYLVATGASSFSLHDMERVEVLRGPQGTLFGRNSTAGLIHFITAKPTNDVFASGSVQYGSYNTFEIAGVLNVPIGDNLSGRVSAQLHRNDGWVDHVTGNRPDGGESKTESIRAQLLFNPSSTVTNLTKISFDNAHGNTVGNVHQVTALNPTTGDQFLVASNQNPYGTGNQRDVFGFGNIGSPDDRVHDSGSPERLKKGRSILASNRLDIEFGDVSVTSVTAYNKYRRDQLQDCDGTQGRICQAHFNAFSDQFSQELRAFADLGALRLTGGVYYLAHKIRLDTIAPLYIDTPNALAIVVDAEQTSRTYAAFGNLEYDLNPQLTVIAGLRVSKDKKHFEETLTYALPCSATDPFGNYDEVRGSKVPTCGAIASNIFTDATVGDLTRIDKNTYSAKLALDYKPTDDLLIYASASRGVKSPGFNNGIVNIALAPQQFRFKQETLFAYEAGIKTTLLDRRLSLSLGGFYYDYKNFHTQQFEGIGSLIANKDAKVYGGEAELVYRPIPELTLRVNGGYTYSKLYDVTNAGGVTADRRMPISPRWTTSAFARYEQPVFDGQYKLGLQVDARARASYYIDPANNSAALNPSYGIVNARIDIADAADQYSLALTAKNLFDKGYYKSIFLGTDIGGYRFGSFGEPRWIGLELRVNTR
jgi:outer membrane receptor protein involved in Fe transport